MSNIKRIRVKIDKTEESEIIDDLNLDDFKNYDYDSWLEFFRAMPADKLLQSAQSLKRTIPIDGYAALVRWLEIIENPSMMDKLYKGKLAKDQDENIMEVAIGDDDEKFYESLIRKNTAQLSSSSISQQEVARLSQNINIFRKELRAIRSHKPKAGTILAKVLDAAKKQPKNKKKASSPRKTTPVKTTETARKATRAKIAKKTTTPSAKTKKSHKKAS